MRQVVINFDPPSQYKQGGLASKAEQVRSAGKGSDNMLIHVNEEEFEWMKENFGPGSVNPDTGLHQFKPFWEQDWFAPVATAAANVFAPGVGSALGSTVGNVFGVTNPAIQAAIGSGLIGGGLGSLSGNALGGAALGAITPYALNSLGLTGSNGALSGLNMYPSTAPAAAAVSPNLSGFGGGSSSPAGVGSSGVMSQIMKAAPLLLAASALGGGGGEAKQPSRPEIDPEDDPGLQKMEYSRKQTMPDIYTDYGFGPEKSFFENNQLPVAAAEGRYVRGGGTGTSDSIPAVLSDGEYVMDAQTVSMLGNGSSDAGAKKLDHMRKQIRKQKGSALAKGNFAPDAKGPLSYMKGAK